MYDLALIRLNQSIRVGSANSICLPELNKDFDPNLNEYGIIAGWGGSFTEGLRLGYAKIKYEKDEEGQVEIILTKKLDDIRLCAVS